MWYSEGDGLVAAPAWGMAGMPAMAAVPPAAVCNKGHTEERPYWLAIERTFLSCRHSTGKEGWPYC